MPVVAVVNSKGGVGKSTIATNLAALFARDFRRVKLIDSDAEQHSADNWLATRDEIGVGAIDGRPAVPAIARQIARGRTYATIRSEAQLWEWIIVDCPGADCPEMRGAMGAANYIVMPVGVGQFDVDALGTMGGLIAEVRNGGNTTPVLAVLNNVPDRCTREAAEAMEVMTGLGEYFDTHGDVLWNRQAVRSALREGRGVHELTGGRDTKAVAEFESLYMGVRNGLA